MQAKYIILWFQEGAMYPIFEVTKDHIAYTKDISKALEFTDYEECKNTCMRIYKNYDLNAILNIVNAHPAQEQWTQKRLDEFLPHWAWLEKYGNV